MKYGKERASMAPSMFFLKFLGYSFELGGHNVVFVTVQIFP
jgi:hypothetical protein